MSEKERREQRPKTHSTPPDLEAIIDQLRPRLPTNMTILFVDETDESHIAEVFRVFEFGKMCGVEDG